MNCPQCGHDNPAGSERCAKCNAALVPARTGAGRGPGGIAVATPPGGTPAPGAGEVTLDDGAPRGRQVRAADAGAASNLLPLAVKPGQVLGDRYEILQLLGEGGMGAVYKARDRALDRIVALKIIRPERASHPEILQRFKQELILARQVTHKNVIRIFDLGEADGVKFITMEFIEGQDLKTLLGEKGKFTVEEAVKIVEQVCQALEAAHAEGVVHRDLKPQNVMVDSQGKVSVMDFGIARSVEPGGMTQTGALMGTPEYMSPEQVRGEHVDALSDLFALGIIFCEVLTGKMPYQADTVMGMMFKRTKERATPTAQLNPSVPGAISDIVGRCLEIDPKRRYQSAAEIRHALLAWRGPGMVFPAAQTGMLPASVSRWMRYAPVWQKWAAAGLAALLLATTGFVFRQKLPFRLSLAPGASAQPVSLAILPFRNASGDAAIDWLGPSLAEMLRTDMGQSAHLRTVPADRLRQILKDLRIPPNADYDPGTLQRLAEFSSAETLVWGQYLKIGDQIRIDATLQDLKRQRTVPVKAEAPNEKELLHAVDRLAQAIQQNLALSADVLKELRAKSSRPSSNSVQALRGYTEGVELARSGNNLEAAKRFEAATEQDPEFALAYSRLALTYSALGYDDKAEQMSRKAMELREKLPETESYLIQANHARILNDTPKAIEAYESLMKVAPDDPDVQFTLAGLYENRGAFDQALKYYGKLLERDPKYVEALLAIGRVRIKSGGKPEAALDDLNRALSLSIQLENDEEKAAALQAIGIAYKLMNKLDEALRNYQESLTIKRRLGQKRGMAASLNEIAQIEVRLGNLEAALGSLDEALQVRREIGDKKGIADTLTILGNFYNDRGRYDQALKLFKESLQIQRDVGDESGQAMGLHNIGNTYLAMGDYENARTYSEQALRIREKLKAAGDIAQTLHNLAETSVRMGQYDEALTQYLRALELRRNSGDKRGAAMESSGLGTLFEYQGRYGAALTSKEEALKTFRELQDRSRWMAAILSSYGHSLSQVGRYEEAQKSLEESLSLARELKNQALVARVLNFQGDSFFYRGDFKSARPLYEQASQEASRANDREVALLSKINLAKVALTEGRSQTVILSLKALMRESDALGLKYLSAECSIHLGEALLNARQYAAARQELETGVRKSEKLGLKALLAQGHYLLAQTFQQAGNREAALNHSREAHRILEEIRKEARSDALSKREDLRRISAEPAGNS